MATTAPQPVDPPPSRTLVGISSLMWASLSFALAFYGIGISIGASYEVTTGPIPEVAFGPVVIASALAPIAAGIGWLVLAPRVTVIRERWTLLAMTVAVLSLLQLFTLADAAAALWVALMHLSVGGVVAYGVPRLLPLDD